MLKLFNTLTRALEDLRPLAGSHVGLYTCGPTVYNYAHIGNLRTYVFEDVLKRTLRHNGLDVLHVMNITDVGHLTDDADSGEDKIETGARREGKSAWDIAEYYTLAFQRDIAKLNIIEPNIWCRATEHIPEQIALVQTLIDKGYTYTTEDGIYFDTAKDPGYGQLAQLQKQSLKAGARVEMGQKRRLHDFALWKFTPAGEKRQMEWLAFGRPGFPGWHIECSAMSMKYLGEQFDIHCGGVDHIAVHHTNEIAQSEAATGLKPWVRYWLHGEFLNIAETKMAKSGENFITLATLEEKGFSPLSYRYFLLQAHYRKQLGFSWEALRAAQTGLENLRREVRRIPRDSLTPPSLKRDWLDALNDDLNTPAALALPWSALKEKQITLNTVITFDKVLGLDLHQPEEAPAIIPSEVQKLLDQRAAARARKNWDESDRLRAEIAASGYLVEDGSEGQAVRKAK